MIHQSLFSVVALAKVDESSTAYRSGEAAGRIAFYVVVVILVIWVGRKLFSKK